MRKVSPESQRTEYKSSWQDEYFQWICGYANSKGGKIYIGVNDDGYVVGVKDTRYLLDTLPNQVVDTMGIVVEIDHDAVNNRGTNIKYRVVPDDIAQKLTGKSAPTVNRYFARLIELDILIPEGENKGRIYRRKPA